MTSAKNWRRLQVRDICSSIDYGLTASASPYSHGPRFLRITDIQEGKVDWSAVPGCNVSPAEVTKATLTDGDIVFARTGATTGKSFLIKRPPSAVFASYLIRLRVDRSVAFPDFVQLYFQSDEYWQQLRRYARGGAQPNVNASLLGNIELPLPPVAEQERIAARLGAALVLVDKARRASEERVTAAEALPAAYLREVFGSVAPFDAAPVPPVIPTRAGWKWHLLTDRARLATGHTPSRRCPEYWSGDVPWIQLPDIRALDGKRAYETSERTNELGIANSAAVLLPEGTVCLSRTASVGFVTIMGRQMATSQDFVNWVCGADLHPDFLMYLFLRCRREIRDLGSGAVHHTIYFPTVEAFRVCVPPVDEQRRIAQQLSNRLAGAATVLAQCRDELAAIEALPAALLREAFGGREG